jgi:hypothetical protein
LPSEIEAGGRYRRRYHSSRGQAYGLGAAGSIVAMFMEG